MAHIVINDTRYTVSQVKAMRKAELIDHVMGLADEVNRLNNSIRDMQPTKTPKGKTPKGKTPKGKTPKTSTWKNVGADQINASFKLAGVTQTMQRRATFALNRGDSPESVADYAVGTRRNTRWTKIKDSAVKARA